MTDVREMTEEELSAYIRERRALLDAQIKAGERPVKGPLKCDKRGPSISGGPHGWAERDDR